MNLDRYAKAIIGTILAGLASAQVALLDNSITSTEWIVVAIAVVTAAGFIWAVPNAPDPATVVTTEDVTDHLDNATNQLNASTAELQAGIDALKRGDGNA